MKPVNIQQAKTHLSRYLKRVKNGESLVICDRNVPVALPTIFVDVGRAGNHPVEGRIARLRRNRGVEVDDPATGPNLRLWPGGVVQLQRRCGRTCRRCGA
ncbi:MAG: type II toxin-antitoxin system Phd/YefM family antitoxin [Polyangia bacterium]